MKKFHYTDPKINLVEGLYSFNSSTNQWTLCSNTPSTDSTSLPDRCEFITWNILSDSNQKEYLYPNERYTSILQILKSFLPDLICLQEVTMTFLELLFNENWLKENHYYIIIMENILKDQSYGQMMLMKNFRPKIFQICSLNSNENEYIRARFELNSNVSIDLLNFHLLNVNEKSLEDLLKILNRRNYMLIGDFNFGDDDLIEETIIQKSKYQLHDLWKDIYDLEEVRRLQFFAGSHKLFSFIESWLYFRSKT